MALAVLKQVESLSAESQTRSIEATRAAEVIPIVAGEVGRLVDRVIESQAHLRACFIRTIADFRLRGVEDFLQENAQRRADLWADLERLTRTLRRDMGRDNDGRGYDRVALAVSAITTRSSSTNRYLRRLAKRARESAELCDEQRGRFVGASDDLMAQVLSEFREQGQEEDFRREIKAAIRRSTAARYPVIIDYLAR